MEGYSDGTIGEIMTEVEERRLERRVGEREEDSGRKRSTIGGGADDDVRAYRHERPTRVGGINLEFGCTILWHRLLRNRTKCHAAHTAFPSPEQ